jgi:hypothetical protein
MSRHVWTVKNLSRETTQRGLYAYCLARNGGRDPHQTEECLWVLEGKFGVLSYGATQQRQEAERQVSASNPPTNFTSLFAP